MEIRSRIFATEVVENTNPRARADKMYIAAYIELQDGTLVPALFTDGDLGKAMKRAKTNKEDVPPPYVTPVVVPSEEKKGWIQKIFG